jgi:hypothetical protein
LLNPENKNLQIREDPEQGIYINGICKVDVRSAEECMQYFQQGDENRTTALTKMNATSSRSHACLILSLEARSKTVVVDEEGSTFQKMTRANLFLVDLAGSERLKKTQASGIRKDEAKYINLSLSTLGIVIHSLEANHSHVPFRDSKLTRLLQDSLAGNGKTRIIVTIGPAASNVQETVSTLSFGQRAMKVKTSARVNETIDFKLLSAQLQQQLDDYDNRCRQLEEKMVESKAEGERLEKIAREASNELGHLRKELEREKNSFKSRICW